MRKIVSVKELGEIITGNTPPRNDPDFYGDYKPFIKATDISESSKYTYKPEEYYSEKAYKKYIRSLIPKGSTCVVTIGSVGKKMTMAHCDLFINQAMNAIVPNQNFDSEYVYYVMKNNIHKLKKLDSGTASGRENVSKSAFSNMEIEIDDDITKQKKIGRILSAYDNLIENNQKQIKLLEEAAQRLYKQWFIDLRYPGHETTKIVDGIPEGWKKEIVGNLIKKVELTPQIEAKDYLLEGKIPVIDQSRNFIAGYTNNDDAIVKENCAVIVFGDHTRILKYIQFPFAKGADGTQLIVSNNECMPQSLFYCSLINVDLSNYHYARHFKYLKAEEIVVPDVQIANKFDKLAKEFFAKIQNCRHQILSLQKSRDHLIPKLMSDKIKI